MRRLLIHQKLYCSTSCYSSTNKKTGVVKVSKVYSSHGGDSLKWRWYWKIRLSKSIGSLINLTPSQDQLYKDYDEALKNQHFYSK